MPRKSSSATTFVEPPMERDAGGSMSQEPTRRGSRVIRRYFAISALVLGWASTAPALDDPTSDESRRVALVARLEDSAVLVKVEGRQIAHAGGEISLQPSGGLGTGVVLSRDGLVMTAAHVVADAEQIMVGLRNGTERAAQVIFADEGADVALLRMESPPGDLVPARLGDSDRVRKGETVYVIGNPVGIESSLSVGVVSGRHKTSHLLGGAAEAEFIQTDAAMNAGNSGGPMFNSRGEVIAVAQRIVTGTGGSEGLGFGLAINAVKKILQMDPCIWLGFSGVPLPASWTSALNVPGRDPLLVEHVTPGSPADKGGLRGGTLPVQVGKGHLVLGGDVVLKIDGRLPLEWVRATPQIGRKPGERHDVRLTVLRDGQIQELVLVTVHREGW
jgi:serine protease Do